MMKHGEVKRLFRAVLAVVIIALLVVAAVIKIIYPSKLLTEFFFMISIFEIALAMAVAVFWNRWGIWAFLALVFATWAGYSLYAAMFGLPCLCLGVAVTLPRGTSLLVNLLMVLLAWVVLRDFNISHKKAVHLALLSCLLVAFGFASASLLYYVRY
jgi:hypothetical protein